MAQKVTQQFVENGFGYLNAKNLDAFFALYAENLSNPSLKNMGLTPDKGGFQKFVGGFYESFSGAKFTPQTILCQDDRAMFRWIFSGKHTGVFNGVKPTGKSVEIDCFTSFRMGPDGKIVEQHEVGDMLSLLKQIGALP